MNKSGVKKTTTDVVTATESEIEAWIGRHRRLYAAGELPEWKIKRLEKIPGWSWGEPQGRMTRTARLEDRLARMVTGESFNA